MGNNLVAIQLAPDLVIPHLTQHDLLNHFASVQVDMNAVKHVCNSANIMRPGITDFTTFKESRMNAGKRSNSQEGTCSMYIAS